MRGSPVHRRQPRAPEQRPPTASRPAVTCAAPAAAGRAGRQDVLRGDGRAAGRVHHVLGAEVLLQLRAAHHRHPLPVQRHPGAPRSSGGVGSPLHARRTLPASRPPAAAAPAPRRSRGGRAHAERARRGRSRPGPGRTRAPRSSWAAAGCPSSRRPRSRPRSPASPARTPPSRPPPRRRAPPPRAAAPPRLARLAASSRA